MRKHPIRRGSLRAQLAIAGWIAFLLFHWSAEAQQTQPGNVFIGRLQAALHTHHIARVSQSVYAANPDGLFILESLEHNQDVDNGDAVLTRLQIFYGGPLSLDGSPGPFGWVGRLEGVRAEPDARLADARWGLQFTLNRHSDLSQWFKEQKADLFVQVFPLRTNRDFGRWDSFTRYSKRFAPQLVTRGFVRTFKLEEGTAVAFENDLIYEIRRDLDVLLRIGKGNRDVPGISEKRWMAGIGARVNF